MDAQEKLQIDQLRAGGMGYSKIAATLNLSLNTVKSYLYRQTSIVVVKKTDTCPNCGKHIKNISGRKPRKFCSDKCRMEWWNSHQDQVKRKAFYTFTCPYCGRQFISYGNKDRKYCSRECYAKARQKVKADG